MLRHRAGATARGTGPPSPNSAPSQYPDSDIFTVILGLGRVARNGNPVITVPAVYSFRVRLRRLGMKSRQQPLDRRAAADISDTAKNARQDEAKIVEQALTIHARLLEQMQSLEQRRLAGFGEAVERNAA